ncbi:MAG: aspartate kinase [Planctomycetes bacterium]|nr:aspartate kinase [Planctomycetota bacterium]
MIKAAEKIGRPVVLQKYGGTSVATAEHIRRVAQRVVARKREGNAVVVVVSAMGKTTDQLVSLSREINQRPPWREMDMLLHAGEIISASLLAMAIEKEGEPAISFTGAQAGMITDASHTRARIQRVQADRIVEDLGRGRIVVITGFQGITADHEVTTLGRGGSDTSAVAFAAGIGANECEILTDVDGVYTADPRVVENPRKLGWCSYDEMLEMASLGARVLHSRSVEIARRFDVPLLVASSFHEAAGTWICSKERGEKEFSDMETVSVRGVAHNSNVAKISLVDVPDHPGVAAGIFTTLSRYNVQILLIVQAEHRGGANDISFLVSAETLVHVEPHLHDLAKEIGASRVVIDDQVGTVSIVGDGIQSDPSIAARMFSSLAKEGINIDLISSSNLMLACAVPKKRLEDAVRAIHREFLE